MRPTHLRTGLGPVLFFATFFAALAGAAPPSKGPTYAGSETCKTCHEEIFNSFVKTAHGTLDRDQHRGWTSNGCESCHGPGAKHAESATATDIYNPAKQTPAKFNQGCLTCHLNQKTDQGRILSGHAKNEIACSSCHSVHGDGGRPLVVRKTTEINSQCASCHVSVWAAFQRPSKHRLPEGAMSCVDCHNPHSSFQPQAMRTSFGREPGCFQCHSDKRGPFTFEHAPVRLEGCSSCHEPHGSANPRMLTRHEERLVCLECHATLPVASVNPQGNLGIVPPAFHDLRSARYQNCTVCHVKVHGSYANRALLR
jgi:DmsE family decaheme c-type cytochrome